MRTLSYVAIAVFFSLTLTACNTTRGIGQDIEATGNVIEETAQSAEESLQDDD